MNIFLAVVNLFFSVVVVGWFYMNQPGDDRKGSFRAGLTLGSFTTMSMIGLVWALWHG